MVAVFLYFGWQIQHTPNTKTDAATRIKRDANATEPRGRTVRCAFCIRGEAAVGRRKRLVRDECTDDHILSFIIH